VDRPCFEESPSIVLVAGYHQSFFWIHCIRYWEVGEDRRGPLSAVVAACSLFGESFCAISGFFEEVYLSLLSRQCIRARAAMQ
jgi:hypothetical protein